MGTTTEAPSPAELKAALGSADALWSDIVDTVAGMVTSVEPEWKPSKSTFGRMCLLKHKKRTLLYLTPDKDEVTVAIVLGQRAYELAMTSGLPARIKQLFSEARPYVEGRGIRFPVSKERDIATIKQLVALKLAPK